MSKSLAQKAKEKGLNVHTVRARIRYGWSEHKALNTPVRQNKIVDDDDLNCTITVSDTNETLFDRVDCFANYLVVAVSSVVLTILSIGLFWWITK